MNDMKKTGRKYTIVELGLSAEWGAARLQPLVENPSRPVALAKFRSQKESQDKSVVEIGIVYVGAGRPDGLERAETIARKNFPDVQIVLPASSGVLKITIPRLYVPELESNLGKEYVIESESYGKFFHNDM